MGKVCSDLFDNQFTNERLIFYMSKVTSRTRERFIKSHNQFASCPNRICFLETCWKKYPAVHFSPKWRDREHSLIGFSIYTQSNCSFLLQQGRANIPRLTTPKCLVFKPKSGFYLILDFKTLTPSHVFFFPLNYCSVASTLTAHWYDLYVVNCQRTEFLLQMRWLQQMCDSSPHLLLMGLGVTLQDISRERKMICKLNSVEKTASCRSQKLGAS